MSAGAEAHRIGRALESVAGWTAEIIVLMNPEVNDGTDRMAEKFGAKVFREPWKGFVGQKNSAADKGSQLWILGLDADEVVPASLRSEIDAMLSQQAGVQSAYSFPRCTFY